MIKLPDHLTIRTEHKHICNVDGLEMSCKEQTLKQDAFDHPRIKPTFFIKQTKFY